MNAIGGVPVRNSKDLISPDTRLCVLCFAPTGFGKTTLAASLDRMTRRFFGKPSLFVGVEAGEGGGAMSIQDAKIDMVVPESLNEIERVFAALATDTTYSGVILDSSTEFVKRFIQPYALKFPSREKQATREAGVPERSDYQTMGERARQYFNQLINLTVHHDMNIRKHLFVTALQKDKMDKEGKVLVAIQPDLPGAMSGNAAAMFQTVLSIQIKPMVVPDPKDPKKTTRINNRILFTDSDGITQVKDRSKCFLNGCEPDLELIYEKFWLPRIEECKAKSSQ